MKLLLIVLLGALIAVPASTMAQADDVAAVLQFQRAADAYAFVHRQQERRGASPPAPVEGAIFTPEVSDAFRSRIRIATRQADCAPVATGAQVPRVNAAPDGTAALPPCIAAVLPKLPDELQYRTASVALVLVDAHLQVVVDVLHAAFP